MQTNTHQDNYARRAIRTCNRVGGSPKHKFLLILNQCCWPVLNTVRYKVQEIVTVATDVAVLKVAFKDK